MPLAQVRDPDHVCATIAAALGIRAASGCSTLARLQDTLRPLALVLVLDNLEHLLPAAPALGELVPACPRLTMLVTSRSRLHLSAEQTYPLPPLALPADDALGSVAPSAC